jgi:hypothetical protein
MKEITVLLVGPREDEALVSVMNELKKDRRPTQTELLKVKFLWAVCSSCQVPCQTVESLHVGLFYATLVRLNGHCQTNWRELYANCVPGGRTDLVQRDFTFGGDATPYEIFYYDGVQYLCGLPTLYVDGGQMRAHEQTIDFIVQSQNNVRWAPTFVGRKLQGECLGQTMQNAFVVGDAAGFTSRYAQRFSGMYAAECIRMSLGVTIWTSFAMLSSSSYKTLMIADALGTYVAQVIVPHSAFHMPFGQSGVGTYALYAKLEVLNLCLQKNLLQLPASVTHCVVDQGWLHFDERDADSVRQGLASYWKSVAPRDYTADSNDGLCTHAFCGASTDCNEFINLRNRCPEVQHADNGKLVQCKNVLAVTHLEPGARAVTQENTVVHGGFTVDGTLCAPRGNGYGYEAHVVPHGSIETLAQMDISKKYTFSPLIDSFLSVIGMLVQREQTWYMPRANTFLRPLCNSASNE